MTDRPWWPEGYLDDPAFQVRRQIGGAVTGGDYVRGSSVPTLPHTALRYPTEVPGADALTNQAWMHLRPYRTVAPGGDYRSVEIQWGWPPGLDDLWLEVALVRSAFGHPSTVMDGETIFIAPRDAFQSDTELISPDLQAPIIEDRPLEGGHWYYYGLFFRVSQVEWIRAMYDCVLLADDHDHQEHLWNSLPPYYQWSDDRFKVGEFGFLRQFLNVFGYELDQTREYVEAWQHCYDIDNSPIKLLRHLGENFDIPYEQGIGDIRYRSLLTRIGFLYDTRGTAPALEAVIQQMSKYECDLTSGNNLMLQPDDSDFYAGTGNWTGLHPSTSLGVTVLTPDKVLLAPDATVAPQLGMGRGTMMVRTLKADATTNMAIACGDGRRYPGPTEITPLYSGIAVRPGQAYSFSVWVRQEDVSPVVVELLWFNSTGLPTGLVRETEAPVATPTVNVWKEYVVQDVAAPTEVYVVPAILFTGRPAGADPTYSPRIWICGAMVSHLGEGGSVSTIAPNTYLTMGDPAEKIGPPDGSHTVYVLGEP